MNLPISIRQETLEDIQVIAEVTEKAFKNHPFSRQTEQFIIAALRGNGALSLSLVAEYKGAVIGHIAFSPITISDGTEKWYGIGPVSVCPLYQKQGVGSALIREGLTQIRSLGAVGCALVGDPVFYKRFGFTNSTNLTHEGIPQEFFLVQQFTHEKSPEGNVTFNRGFMANE
ncbi:MAG: N-acetyltransferase [Opitutales bacterium]|nr:N-acetyltransferase [Opitutales bacterium]